MVAYPVLSGTNGPWNSLWAVKVVGAVDLEAVMGERLLAGICRYKEADDGRYYYRDCDPTSPEFLTAYAPRAVEGSAPLRFFAAGYGVLDMWRIRLGGGYAGHPGSGDGVPSVLIGFAATPNTWLMAEWLDFSNEWRLRIEVGLYGPPFIW